MKVPILVLAECAAGHVPSVLHVFPLTRVREVAAAGRAAHREAPDRSARNLVEILVDDLRFVIGRGGPGDARPSIVETAADEHVQHFRRAQAVEDRHAGAPRPGFADRRRKRLARGYGQAERGQIGPLVERREHRAVRGRRREADGRLVGLDDLDEIRRGRAFEQSGGGAEAERKNGKYPEPEGGVDRRRVDKLVVWANLLRLPRTGLSDNETVAVKVHRRLGRAYRPGGAA